MVLLKPVGMRSPHRGCFLSTWLLCPGRLVLLYSKEWNNQKAFGSLPPPGHSRQTHSVFLWKRSLYLSWTYSLRGRLRFTTYLEAMEMLSRNLGWGCHVCTLSWLHNNWLVPPRKKLIHFPGTPIFVTVFKGTPPDQCTVCDSSPTRLHIFAYFKGCCLRVCLLISPELGLLSHLCFEQQQISTQLQQVGPIKNKSGCLDNHRDSRDNQELGKGWTIGFISYPSLLFQA